MQQPPAQNGPTRNAIRVSLACVQCRSRHLRCDAVTPTCNRCHAEGSECTYLKSRRGGRSRATARQADTQTTVPTLSSECQSVAAPATKDESAGALNHVPALLSDRSGSASASSTSSNLGDDHLSVGSPSSVTTREPLLDLYYKFFHPAQPCVLPMHYFKQKMNEDIPGIRLLALVMRFIGSLYTSKVSSSPLEENVKIALQENHPYTTGFEIQALILYSTATYWSDDMPKASELLDVATAKALAIGMNLKEFAVENSMGDPVLAECWRRTWWQLYLTDAHIASSNHAIGFGTSQRNVPATVELPCEEADYSSGNIPFRPKTLLDYDNREFALDDDADFSSFAYLIGLLRSLDLTIIGIERGVEENVKEMCTRADSSVAAWLSLLSKSKRKLFRDDGTLDELLFKAHCLIQVYTVDIHRLLSTLTYSPIEAVSSCAPPPPPERLAPVYYRDAHIHTAKILRAIERLTDLLTLPGRIAFHSPFTICMVATTTIGHLAACKYVFKGEQLKVARERIRVAMGALDALGEVWPRGKIVAREVKTVARELLSLEPTTEARKEYEGMQLSAIGAPVVLNQSSDPVTDFYSGMSACGYFDFSNSNFNVGSDLGFTGNAYDMRSGFGFDVTTEY